MNLPVTTALLTQQAKDYKQAIDACIDTPNCVGVTVSCLAVTV
jgi:hypothetical protein